jgi:hypothetical protein
MSIHTVREVLLTVFLVSCGGVLSAQQQAPPNAVDQLTIPPRILPLPPKELLSLLPPTPVSWKVTSSAATNQISSWLVTIAQRQIESPQPETPGSTGANAQALPPMRTTFMLIDSGYDPSATGAFVDFKPAKFGNIEKAFFLNCPMIRARPSVTSESLQMLINRRFVFHVETQNQQKDSVLRWAQQIPMAKYNIPQTGALTILPPKVVIRSVDEVNPRNDHESNITIASPTPLPR